MVVYNKKINLKNILIQAWYSLFCNKAEKKYKYNIKATLLITICMVVVTFCINIDRFNSRKYSFDLLGSGSHAMVQMQIAVNKVLCGFPSSINPEYVKARRDITKPFTPEERPLDVLAFMGIDKQTYCNGCQPTIQNENSLAFVNTALLRVFPEITLREMAGTYSVLRFLLLIPFCFVLLYSGMGLFFCYAIFFAALDISALSVSSHSIAQYQLVLPGILFVISMLYISFTLLRNHNLIFYLSSFLILGPACFFVVNVRTSYGMILFPVIIFTVLYFIVTRNKNTLSLVKAWLIAVCFVGSGMTSYVIIQHILISPITDQKMMATYPSYHTIAHPLVLSLAFPYDNALALKEGITWKDAVGPILAARVSDTPVVYRSIEYEKALFTYYRGLWEKYPDAMLGLYYKKFSLVSKDIRRYFKSEKYDNKYRPGQQLKGIYKVFFSITPSGIIYPFLLGLAVAVCFFLPRRFFYSNLMLLTGQIFIAGFAAYGESGIIYPYFAPTTNGPNAFFMLYFTLTCSAFFLTSATYFKKYPKWKNAKSLVTHGVEGLYDKE